MNFLAPEMLLGLLLVPIAIGFYLWAQRRRSKYAVRFTNLALLSNLVPKRPSWRRHLPPVLYLGAIAALLIGLARPTLIVPVPREDATVILTMDVSGSMRATDVSPTRLDAARASALSFIEQLPENVRVGIVAFASEPVDARQPDDRPNPAQGRDREPDRPRRDRDGRRAHAGPRHRREDPGRRGRDARRDARRPLQPRRQHPTPRAPRARPVDEPSNAPLVAAILLSDGANSVGETEPEEAAARAKALGVPIYTIALGTPDGEVTVRDEFGQLQTLEVPPDTETLQDIASTTGGTAFDAPTAEELKSVYDNLQSRIGYTEERQEVTFALVAAGLLLVVVGAGHGGGLVRPASVGHRPRERPDIAARESESARASVATPDFCRIRATATRARADLRDGSGIPGGSRPRRPAPASPPGRSPEGRIFRSVILAERAWRPPTSVDPAPPSVLEPIFMTERNTGRARRPNPRDRPYSPVAERTIGNHYDSRLRRRPTGMAT